MIRACVTPRIRLLAEKPPAFSIENAAEIEHPAREHNTVVSTNHQTSRCASIRTIARLATETGPIDRAASRHGRRRPVMIC
ncbi:MAG: hypothetical protein D6692_09060 [Planctomycetota bacterium]|nr:MAG: hypothetical protein D6692_09060 [Planctomycetota bacterium]